MLLSIYRGLASLGIFLCGKSSHNRDQFVKKAGSELPLFFIRAGLLFEFKMLQRALQVITSLNNNGTLVLPSAVLRMSSTVRKNLVDYYKRLVDIWLLEDKPSSFVVLQCKGDVSYLNFEMLLKNMSEFYFHKKCLVVHREAGWDR